jgi:putative methyltransferase (TIGR04325 family)
MLKSLRNFFKSKFNDNEQRPLPVWEGNYSSWDDIKALVTGYDLNLILEKCKESLLKIKNGEAVYERDSVLFDRIEYSWPLLAVLLKSATENLGEVNVLDFGGSLGSTYFQNRSFLSHLKRIKWNIVEQDNFVDCGKNFFENSELHFFNSPQDVAAHDNPDIILFSSVLQYLEKPCVILKETLDCFPDSRYLVIDRFPMTDSDTDILTIQNVPSRFYESRLGHWFFSAQFINRISDFKLIGDSKSFADSDYILNDSIPCYFKTLIFERK